MDKISCEIKLKIGNELKSPQEILKKVKDLEKYVVFLTEWT